MAGRTLYACRGSATAWASSTATRKSGGRRSILYCSPLLGDGITDDTLLMRMSEAQWDRVIDVNLKSCFALTKAVLRTLLKARSGSIINVSSIYGVV